MANGEKGNNTWVWIAIVIVVIVLIIVIIGAFVISSRSNDNTPLGGSCGNSGDCSGNLVCQNRSNPSSNNNKVCLAPNGDTCNNNDNNCTSGLVCLNNVCSTPLL